MLVSAFIAFLIVGQATACSFTKELGSGTGDVTYSGTEDFAVAPGASTTCSLSCDGGGDGAWGDLPWNYVALRFGSAAATILQNHRIFYVQSSCNIDPNPFYSNSGLELKLSWRVYVKSFHSNLQLTCTCSEAGTVPPPSPSPDGSPVCFSKDARVDVQGRFAVPMEDLEVGDMVKVGGIASAAVYEPVYGFGHFHATDQANFLRLYTNMSKHTPLEITANHLVYVTSSDGEEHASRADKVQIGDTLLHDNGLARVTRISSARKSGVYMPLTASGSIVVDGIKASTYASILEDAPQVVETVAFFGFTEQRLVDWWMSPHRMLCLGVSTKFCGHKTAEAFSDESGILGWLLFGKNLAEYGNRQTIFVRVILLGIPMVVIFGIFNFVEQLFGATWAPVAVLALGAMVSIWKRTKNAEELDVKKD